MVNNNTFYNRIIKTIKLLITPVVKIDVKGLENVPDMGGYIIAPNHVSHLDPMILGTILSKKRPVRALAKSSLFTLPVVGKVLTKMGHIPVYRNSREAKNSLTAAEEGIRNGEVIAIYPEGTIDMSDALLGDFKTGVARLSLATQCSVLPVAQMGAQKAFPPGKKTAALYLLKALFTRPKHYVLVGKLITPEPEETAAQFTSRLKSNIHELMLQLRNVKNQN